MPFRTQDRGPLVPLSTHLLFHRVLNRSWRVDSFDLHSVDTQAPLASGIVQNASELTVDDVEIGRAHV